MYRQPVPQRRRLVHSNPSSEDNSHEKHWPSRRASFHRPIVITMALTLIFLFLPPGLMAQDQANFDGAAELPRVYVNTSLNDTPSPLNANQPTVQTFEELQSAVNRAACGEVIQLNAGTTFRWYSGPSAETMRRRSLDHGPHLRSRFQSATGRHEADSLLRRGRELARAARAELHFHEGCDG